VQYNYTRNPALANPKVRAALDLGTDRTGVNNAIMFGQCDASNQPLTKVQAGYSKTAPKPKYDVAAAKKLLADAGYPNGLTLKGEAYIPEPYNSFATAMQGQWAKMGVTVDMTVVSTNPLVPWLAGNYDVYFVASSAYPDMAQTMAETYTQNPVRLPFASDPTATQMIADIYAKPIGSKERVALMEKMSTYVAKNPGPSLVVCQWPVQYLYRSNIAGITDQMSYGKLVGVSDLRGLTVSKS